MNRKAKIMAQMSAMQKNFAAGHKTLLEGMKVCVMHWFLCVSHAKGCSVYLAAGHKTLLEGMKVCVMHWFSCCHAK